MTFRLFVPVSAAYILLSSAGCVPRPRPIEYGQDLCANCRMTVADRRYGAEMVTRKGKTLPTDSAECLAALCAGGEVPPADTHSLWVTDYARPETLIDAHTAFYVLADSLPSPMGLNVTAFGDEDAARQVAAEHRGVMLAWTGVVDVVRTKWRLHAAAPSEM